jgi:hypothetical protein
VRGRAEPYRAGDRSLRFAIRSARLALDPVEPPEAAELDAA